MDSVVNVAIFAEDSIREELVRLTKAREKALDLCYGRKGYEDLPLKEKNKIYDEVIKEVMKWEL